MKKKKINKLKDEILVMEKNCIYCGTHFTSKRKSRKYCSDNCKQMAYFKRNGLIFSGNSETVNVKYERPVTIKTENIKYLSPLSHNIKDEDQSFKKAMIKCDTLTMDQKTLDTLISRLTITMECKIAQAIENVKQELTVKCESLIAKAHFMGNDKIKNTVKQRCYPVAYTGAIFPIIESTRGINHCPPCEGINIKYDTVNENTITSKNQPSHFTFTEIEETTLKNTAPNHSNILNAQNNKERQEEDQKAQQEEVKEKPYQLQALELTTDRSDYNKPELEDMKQENKQGKEEREENNTETTSVQELEQKTDTQKLALENKNPLTKEQYEEQEEPEYKWVESKFIKSIEKNKQENNEYMFKEPLAYWNIDKVIKINWISIRLRCLLESMIKLSNYSKIDSHTLLSITDAFNRLTQSDAFRNLPDNYPYTELIKGLCIKLNRLVQKGTYSEQLKFSLSDQLKSQLISTRSEMLPYFPAIKFSELDFSERNSALEKDEKDEQEEKVKPKKDWEYGFDAWKRKRYGEPD